MIANENWPARAAKRPRWRISERESSLQLKSQAAEADGRRGLLRRFLWAGALLAALMGSPLAHGDEVVPGERIRLQIERQRADRALIEFARQSNLTLLFPFDEARKVTANMVRGEFTAEEAITILLEGTGLKPLFGAGGALTISTETGPYQGGEAVQKKSMWASIFAALFGVTPAAVGAETAQELQVETPGLPEIVVTAQKRSDRLQDVPVPVSVIAGDELVDQNRLRIQDYATSVPSLNLTPNVQGIQNLSIRGITTGGGSNPTVGIVIDDVPYGASTAFGSGLQVPDFDPGDLEQVEVLRGPQGTFYGASSMGGLLKFVTRDPSTDEFSGRIQAGTNSIAYADDPGVNLRAAVNIPLGESLALRASAFVRSEPGYIDNTLLDRSGINEGEMVGGRLTALWHMSDKWSLRLSAQAQQDEADGNTQEDVLLPGVGEREQTTVYDAGAYETTSRSFSATLRGRLGGVEIVSLSGYSVNRSADSFDFSYAFGDWGQSAYGAPGTPVRTQGESTKFTQELRLTIPLHERVDWLLGAFFTDEDNRLANQIPAMVPDTGVVKGYLFDSTVNSTFEEYAAFTDLTFQLSDRIDLQVGARLSEIDQTSQNTTVAPYAIEDEPPPPNVGPRRDTEGDAVTYLFTPRFKIADDLMLYGRLASGYRAGGANNNPGGVAPVAYDPDTTTNYEVGFKGAFLDGALTVDASIYYIDWDDLQLQLNNPENSTSYTTNVSSAESTGLELAGSVIPWNGATISAWAVFGEAVVAEAFPATSSVYGASGDRLPYSSERSAHMSFQQVVPMSGGEWSLGGSISYVGDRKGVFTSTPTRETLPSYTKLDLRAGLAVGQWAFDLVVNNVTNERGVLTGGIGATPPYAFRYLRPREYALNVVRDF